MRIAAASDLALAWPDLATAFTANGGAAVQAVFGSSGQLAAQTAAGAPFAALLAADAQYVAQVAAAKACAGATALPYATGRLAVVVAHGVALPKHLEDLQSQAYARIAIANPEHAPYGRAAAQALATAGIADAVAPKLVRADTVRQALQWVQLGHVQAALVAVPLVAGQGVAYWPVPAAMHGPLHQVGVACGAGRNAAVGEQFVRFLAGPSGQKVLARFGFGPP